MVDEVLEVLDTLVGLVGKAADTLAGRAGFALDDEAFAGGVGLLGLDDDGWASFN
jgi:hypothetical protein